MYAGMYIHYIKKKNNEKKLNERRNKIENNI